MTTEIVWSPIKETKKKNITNSPVWTAEHRYKDDEMTDEIRKIFPTWYKYTIKFEGLTPLFIAKMKTV